MTSHHVCRCCSNMIRGHRCILGPSCTCHQATDAQQCLPTMILGRSGTTMIGGSTVAQPLAPIIGRQ